MNDSLQQEIIAFNRAVRTYEHEQLGAIRNAVEQVELRFLKQQSLSDQYREELKCAFSQALANLNGLMDADNAEVLQLYYESLVAALQTVGTPRVNLIHLQTDIFSLDGGSQKMNAAIAFESRVEKIQAAFQHVGFVDDEKFAVVTQILLDLKQSSENNFLTAKKNCIAELHELYQDTAALAEVDNIIADIKSRAYNLQQVRATNMDKYSFNSNLQQLERVAYPSWFVLGLGITIAGVVLAFAPVALPAVAVGLSMAGFVTSSVSLAKDAADAVTDKRFVSLGSRKVVRPQLTRWQRIKRSIKQLQSPALCLVGLALGVTSFALGGGVIIAGLGIALTVVGLGMTGYSLLQQRKQREKQKYIHRKMNESFKPKCITQSTEDEEEDSEDLMSDQPSPFEAADADANAARAEKQRQFVESLPAVDKIVEKLQSNMQQDHLNEEQKDHDINIVDTHREILTIN